MCALCWKWLLVLFFCSVRWCTRSWEWWSRQTSGSTQSPVSLFVIASTLIVYTGQLGCVVFTLHSTLHYVHVRITLWWILHYGHTASLAGNWVPNDRHRSTLPHWLRDRMLADQHFRCVHCCEMLRAPWHVDHHRSIGSAHVPTLPHAAGKLLQNVKRQSRRQHASGRRKRDSAVPHPVGAIGNVRSNDTSVFGFSNLRIVCLVCHGNKTNACDRPEWKARKSTLPAN